MKIALVAINAKYIHTNLAVRSLAAYAALEQPELNLEILEFTINQPTDRILAGLYGAGADCYLFSGYIWNVAMIEELAASLRALLPRVSLGIGGPETTYRSVEFLAERPAFDFVLCGEGEAAFAQVCRCLTQGQPLPSGWGITGRNSPAPAPPPAPMDLDRLPFPYRDLDRLQGRIVYYESSRGCPFSCAYCLSSVERGVRLRSLPLVFQDLRRFLAAGVRQVKFVDRTFNCNRERAVDIWKFLCKEDNGVTNFHFELAGDLLDQESLDFLAAVRPGLFQFEIGVQTTNPKTLREIGRSSSIDRVFSSAQALGRAGNIHLHLDLIAGLPWEDEASFRRSFDQVYRLRPHQLQLGILKVLPGSSMERRSGEWDLVYSARPPYQILQTRWLSYPQLETLKGVSQMVELYYNSGRFQSILEAICGRFSSPFAFYEQLWAFFQAQGCVDKPPSKVGAYELLAGFLEQEGAPATQRDQWLCKYDLLLHERPRRMPAWVEVDLCPGYTGEIRSFYHREENIRRWLPEYVGEEPRRISRLAHMEVFPFHPSTGRPGRVYALFHYERRDVTGRAQAFFFSEIDPLTGQAQPEE